MAYIGGLVTEQENLDFYVSLKAHLEIQIANLKSFLQLATQNFENVIQERFRAHSTALDLASKVLDARLDRLNELREAVTQQENRYSTKAEVEARFNGVEKDVRQLLLARAEMAGKASQNAVIFAWGIGAAGLITAIISLLLRFIGK